MLDHAMLQPRLFTAKINNIPLRFVVFDEPDAEVWLAYSDVLAAARYPRAARRRMLKDAPRSFPAEHVTIELDGRRTLLVRPHTGRTLVMCAAELDYCPDYLSDVFEVVSAYAQDQLLSRDPPVCADLVDALSVEAGK